MGTAPALVAVAYRRVRHSRRRVNRLSIQDLSGAIIPVIHYHKKNEGGKILIAVDDMTRLTPTQ